MNGGAALRRYEAVDWLERLVGPLGIPSEPNERDFISSLRNGIILCNVINKIHPGTISKVVENHVPVEYQSNVWDSRPLPAYQYFENVRNFLVAVEELKLPAFEASDLQREISEAGSACRIADCILALKSYHEWKQRSGGNGVYKHVTVKSPHVMHSASDDISRPLNKEAVQPRKQLDMHPAGDKESLTESIVKVLSDGMVNSKENLNGKFLNSQKRNQDPVQIFTEVLSGCLEEKLRNQFSPLNLQENSVKAGASHHQPISILKENVSFKSHSQCSRAQSRNSGHDHWRRLHSQKKNLADIKALWSETKSEFEALQNQLMNDLNHLGSLVGEMADRARGYQKVVQENRKLFNMVQDLKGNIRVCCRIRPMLNSEAKNVVSFQGDDGILVISDPTKLQAEGRKEYSFTCVYGPTATQDDLFKDAQPLIRSVLDGYNLCILVYGQSRSGKSYTMYGPSDASEKEMGVTFFALGDLFESVNKRKYLTNYELHLQMVEICNEQVQDLLAEIPTQHDESSISNVSSHAVKSDTEAINLVRQGQVRRTCEGSDGTSNSSNYSHSVVTIYVKGTDLSGKILHSRLHLVDLAGNGEDDKSLSCLEDAITSLSQKKSYIHYRDSKLTTLLQDALGDKAKILVFAHVIPEGENFTKTVMTLKFAERISTIERRASHSNKNNSEIKELKDEIESLKIALGDKITCNPQATKQPKSPCDYERVTAQRIPVKFRRLSLENQGKGTSATPQSSLRVRRLSLEGPKDKTLTTKSLETTHGDEITCDSQTTKQPKSPRDNERLTTQRIPVKLRRLSLENQGKRATATPQSSLRVKRLSLEGPKDNTLTTKSLNSTHGDKITCDSQTITQPKSLSGNPRVITQRIPVKSRRLSLENQGKGATALPETSLRIRRLSLEGPKDTTLTDNQTPGNAKSTNCKESQIKKSFRTIGKLISGSEKRNQHKVESTSTKSKDGTNGAKSPPSSTARLSRRHSLTGIPPSGTSRRTSLGGKSTG